MYEITLESVCPSPFGVIVRGSAVAELIASATGFAPSIPTAGRTESPAAIVQPYDPCNTVAESHVQSMSWLVPVPLATTLPVASVIVTVQGSGSLRRAWKRTWPPRAPRTEGAYSFGRPALSACLAIASSWA